MISEEEFSKRPAAGKWSRKEVLGHLIDSAQNNLRRFITGQYEASPPNITYQQDFWVAAQGYHQAKATDLILLWKLINERIAATLESMPKENYEKTADTGRGKPDLHALSWLAADYVKHMKHHMNQILPGSFNITYP